MSYNDNDEEVEDGFNVDADEPLEGEMIPDVDFGLDEEDPDKDR